MTSQRLILMTAILSGVLMVSCAVPAAPPAAPTQPPAPLAAPTQTAVSSSTAVPTNVAAVAATSVAARTAAPTASAASAPQSPAPAAGNSPDKLDMNKIFPPGAGRDLVLNNCTTCHTIVPIVVLQMSPAQWDASSQNHRDRVSVLTDAEFKSVYDYLKANFNPDKPVPQLPKELLQTWTSY